MATYASSFKISDPAGPTSISGSHQGIHDFSSTKNYALGTRVRATDPVLGESEFIYATGVASTAVGNLIQINGDYTTVRAAGGTIKGLCGVAMSASVASTYGWYCIKGGVLVLIAADVTADVPGYATASAGVWADDIVAGSHVIGSMLMNGTDAAGSAIPGTTDTLAAHFTVARIFYPYVVKAV